MDKTIFLVVASLALLPPFAKAASSKEPAFVYDISRNCRALVIPVTIKGAAHKFILSTASTHSFIDNELASTLELRLRGRALVLGDPRTPFLPVYSSSGCSIGTISFKNNSGLIGTDMSFLEPVFYDDDVPRGVIGMDFLADVVLQINFVSGELCFFEHGFPGRAMTEGTEEVHIDVIDRLPYVRASVGGEAPELLLINTSSSRPVSVRPDKFERLRTAGNITSVLQSWGMTFGGIESIDIGRVNSFVLGTFKTEYVSITATAGNSAIGLSHLRRFHIIADFPSRRLYLSKNELYDCSDHWDWDGLRIVERRVVAVADGSYAMKQGFRVGDTIVALNGMDLDGLHDGIIYDIIARRARDLIVTIERDGGLLPIMLPYK